MAGNSYGQAFRISTFGESHGRAVGVVIDGCPAGLAIDTYFIASEMARRKPGQSALSSQRKEEDQVEILSGVFEGKSTGAPVAMLVYNKDQRPEDYERFREVYRPSHADYTYDSKYGFRDHRGGGRSSARETLARVASGAIAKMLLKQESISIQAFVSQVGEISLNTPLHELDLNLTESNMVRCPDPETAERMTKLIEKVRDEPDSLGGIISCVIRNCPTGLGEPVFDKLHAELGKAMLSINAVKGFEIGSGFSGSAMLGSQHNDAFREIEGQVRTVTNHSGGIQGGISNGEEIFFRVAFKPVATIAKAQETLNREGESVLLEGKGRHDPCVLPRAVPIVEAMAALVLADFLLRQRMNKLSV
jgi:chorismate synthase